MMTYIILQHRRGATKHPAYSIDYAKKNFHLSHQDVFRATVRSQPASKTYSA